MNVTAIVAPVYSIPNHVKSLGNILAKAYKYSAPAPGEAEFFGSAHDIFESLHILGEAEILPNDWLPERFRFMATMAPALPTRYQDPSSLGGNGINGELMIADLMEPLIKMGAKFGDRDMLDCLELLCKACRDEAEFLVSATAIKPLAMPQQSKDWANVIKPFQRRLSKRLWDERGNGGDHQGGLSEHELRIKIKAFIAEKDPYKRDRMLAEFYSLKISDKRLNALVSYEKAASSTRRSDRLKPSDFRTLASEGKKWLVPSLFPSVGVTLVTAPPGGFKTTFAFDLAGSVINGTSFMGEPIAENGPVVFACSDEPITEAQERATMQGFIHSEDYEYLDNWNIGQLDLLEESIADLRPKLVIVDSFDSIHRDAGHDENTTASSMAIKALNDLSKKYSTQILIIHHENKDPKLSGVNKSRGSTAIVAAANAHIRLLPVPNESGRVIVAIEKMRGAATRKILCDIDFYNVRFEPEVNLEWEQQAGQREIILSFLQNNPGRWFEPGELNHYLGWAGKGIYKPLKQLSSRGEIMVKPNSMGRKGMVYGVCCTDLANQEEQNYTPPPHTEIEQEKNNSQTYTQQGIEGSHLLVTSQSPFSHLSVTSENLDTSENLTGTDSHLVTSEGGSKGGVCESTNQEIQPVPQTKTEEIPPVNVYTPTTEETTTTAIADEPKTKHLPQEGQHFQPGDLVVEAARPNLLLALRSIDDDGEFCRCLDLRFGGEELCLLADLCFPSPELLEGISHD
jgi:hypothetical protein